MTKPNPWEQQYTLMEISNQYIAKTPEFNKTSLLYSALVLEETSELFAGLRKVVDRLDEREYNKLYVIVNNICNLMHMSSLEIRNIIKELPEMHSSLTHEEAIEFADASTDIAVVNCGFAVSTGFDGQACYDDVVGSNLSKANPVTGVIDKTSDGKWIKGANYREPNLEKVIYGDKNE